MARLFAMPGALIKTSSDANWRCCWDGSDPKPEVKLVAAELDVPIRRLEAVLEPVLATLGSTQNLSWLRREGA